MPKITFAFIEPEQFGFKPWELGYWFTTSAKKYRSGHSTRVFRLWYLAGMLER